MKNKSFVGFGGEFFDFGGEFFNFCIKKLKLHEGFSKYPYTCSAEKITIGYGTNLEDRGISTEEALMFLKNDIKRSINDIPQIVKNYDSLSFRRKYILVDMFYNLGFTGFSKFKKMIKAIEENDFDLAALEMENSKWYKQVGERAVFLTGIMKNESKKT